MGRVETHEDLEELLGVYALDALDKDEAALVSRHLATCPRCRAEVAANREVAGLLGYVGQEAPEGLWDRIAANLEDAPPAVLLDRVPGTGNVVPFQPVARRRRVRAFAAAATAVAAAIIAVLGVQVARLDNRTNNQAYLGPSMSDVRTALAQPGNRQVALRPSAGGAPLVDAVIEANGTGYLYGSNLQALPADRTYQLWGVVGNNRISYGVIGHAPGIEPIQVSDGVSALAVTDEVAGGAVNSSNPPVALGSITPAV